MNEINQATSRLKLNQQHQYDDFMEDTSMVPSNRRTSSISGARLLSPDKIERRVGECAFIGDIQGGISALDITDQSNKITSLQAQLGFGPAKSSPCDSGWLWIEAEYEGQGREGDLDAIFKAALYCPPKGDYSFVYRFRVGMLPWVYADLYGIFAPIDQPPPRPGILNVVPGDGEGHCECTDEIHSISNQIQDGFDGVEKHIRSYFEGLTNGQTRQISQMLSTAFSDHQGQHEREQAYVKKLENRITLLESGTGGTSDSVVQALKEAEGIFVSGAQELSKSTDPIKDAGLVYEQGLKHLKHAVSLLLDGPQKDALTNDLKEVRSTILSANNRLKVQKDLADKGGTVNNQVRSQSKQDMNQARDQIEAVIQAIQKGEV
jgi:hypothetical protein